MIGGDLSQQIKKAKDEKTPIKESQIYD